MSQTEASLEESYCPDGRDETEAMAVDSLGAVLFKQEKKPIL